MSRPTLFAPAVDLLEHDFTEQVIGTKANPGIARQTGWKAYHVFRSKRSEAGFPDWTLVRERLVHLELKTATGKVSDPQKQWGRALLGASVEFYIPRPRDLDLLALILSSRANPATGLLSTTDAEEARRILRAQTREEIA